MLCNAVSSAEHSKSPRAWFYSQLFYLESAGKASEARSGSSETAFTLRWSETSCTVYPLTQNMQHIWPVAAHFHYLNHVFLMQQLFYCCFNCRSVRLGLLRNLIFAGFNHPFKAGGMQHVTFDVQVHKCLMAETRETSKYTTHKFNIHTLLSIKNIGYRRTFSRKLLS